MRRLKKGHRSIHPLQNAEVELLNQWIPLRTNYLKTSDNEWLFLSQLGRKLSRQRIYIMIRDYALASDITSIAHPHMLSHACGYELADQGMDTRLIQDYLGHRNIRHTVHYTSGNINGLKLTLRFEINTFNIKITAAYSDYITLSKNNYKYTSRCCVPR